MTTNQSNWESRYEIIWDMGLGILFDDKCGCYGKYEMVKKELAGFIRTLLTEQREEMELKIALKVNQEPQSDEDMAFNEGLAEALQIIKSKKI